MKAAWRERYGGPEVVSIFDVPRPQPKAGEVLVRVVAASVNRGDLDGLEARWWFVRLFGGVRRPKPAFQRIGVDVAGVVEAVGDGVTGLRVGDDVFSDMSSYGSQTFAEYVCAPEAGFAPMPPSLTHEEAACLPHSGVLAVRAFDERGGRKWLEGDRVLVVGASGSVGPFCIQIAKSLGMEITAVASAEKLDFVRALGANHAIDYKATDYTRPAQPFDLIIDVTAHHPLRRWRSALTRGGVYVSYGGTSWWIISTGLFWGPLLRRISGRWMGLAFVGGFGEKDRAKLHAAIAQGTLKPVIDRRFPLDEVADALRYVHEGHPRGKVLVIP